MEEKDFVIPAALEIYVHSDIYNHDNSSNRGSIAEDWCKNHVPYFAEDKEAFPDVYKPIETALIEVGKKLGITRKDVQAIWTEIGANVTEEIGAKMRSLMGRWVNNCTYKALVDFLLGYLKLSVDMSLRTHNVSKELDLLEEDGTENLVVPCAICLSWCLLIETGVAAEKGIHDNKLYMPETLETVISIDKLSRTKGYNEKNMKKIFRTMFDILINNNQRYDGKRPHESEITYLIVVKNALKRIGVDPCEYVYRALDNDRQDWSLFAFITENV